VIFDLELGARRIVPKVFERATLFILDSVRSSSVTSMFFAATPALSWVREFLGTPRWFSDDLGLAAPAWLGRRSLPCSISDEAEVSVTTSPTLASVYATRSPPPRVPPAEVLLAPVGCKPP
jgi:hypothetical protein